MSVVVAVKDKDTVYFGADSQATRGGTRQTLKNPNNYKIWKVIDVENSLMGSVGKVRDACVVRLIDNLVTDFDLFKYGVDYDFVVTSIVPQIVKVLQNCEYYKDEKPFEGLDSSFLFAYKDKLYSINGDCSVLEIDDYVAIGSGSSEAMGSLLSTEGMDPEERIVRAIKASAASDIYVDYPIILSNTDDTEFKIVTETNEKEYIKNKGGNK